jgi:hypothetical protein
MSFAYIYCQQFYVDAFSLKIIGHGNTDNNLESLVLPFCANNFTIIARYDLMSARNFIKFIKGKDSRDIKIQALRVSRIKIK